MNLTRRSLLGGMASAATGLAAPSAFAAVAQGMMPPLLARARHALDSHGARISHRDVIGLVDFGAPSGQRRFQIVDLAGGRVVASHLVAHGRGSDPGNSGMVQRFSNQPGSNASSSGSFLVGEDYRGKYGRSRRVIGLEPQNDMAYERAIVIHSADYVCEAMARDSGRVGRSLGCFTLSHAEIAQVLARLGPGRMLFAGR